jgi:2-haloacid dehalogenase
LELHNLTRAKSRPYSLTDPYLSACEALDLPPASCMMVAAHTKDLLAAAKVGLRAAHIARPNEHGPGKGEARPSAQVDIAAASLEDLAMQLGA